MDQLQENSGKPSSGPGKQWFTNTLYNDGKVLFTLTRDILRVWKEYFKDLLIPIKRSLYRRSWVCGLWSELPIFGGEVIEKVKKLFGDDEVHPASRLWILWGCLQAFTDCKIWTITDERSMSWNNCGDIWSLTIIVNNRHPTINAQVDDDHHTGLMTKDNLI